MEEGEMFYCRELAETYKLLRDGADFYAGHLAAIIVEEIRNRGKSRPIIGYIV
jgi:gamma-glutamyltranspeptidase